MLRPRVIASLLLHNRGLVKTVNFGSPKYVGDPLNAVRIFNEKEVDELAIFDLDATSSSLEPNVDVIRNLARECRMPFCYGGGVKTVQQAARIVSVGVEKVAVGSAIIQDPRLLTEMAKQLGSQSVVAVLDVRHNAALDTYEVWINNGRHNTRRSVVEVAKEAEESGVGEVVLNSIDRDGTMNGYDFNLVRSVRTTITTPMTVLGGAGSLRDIENLFREFGVIGAAAGSLFVFKGPLRAVLINYPNRDQKQKLWSVPAPAA